MARKAKWDRLECGAEQADFRQSYPSAGADAAERTGDRGGSDQDPDAGGREQWDAGLDQEPGQGGGRRHYGAAARDVGDGGVELGADERQVPGAPAAAAA